MRKAKIESRGGYRRPAHRVFFILIKAVAFLYTRLVLGYRCRDKYRQKDGESVLVLCNHQTDLDILCILPCFSRPVYPVAADSIFAGKGRSRLLSYFGVIPKKKAASDLRCVVRMYDYLRNGSSVLLFPEGNRYYAEFQYYVTESLPKFIKNTGSTLVLFNLHGGNGKDPRFKHKRRRGRFTGCIKEVIPPDVYSAMPDGELLGHIMDGIRVFDSDSGEKYKSRRRAEYLERMLFVCPVCGKFETLYSKGSHIYCSECGMKAEYTEDLHLKSDDGQFPFTRLCEWWDFQKAAVRDMEPKDGAVFSDKGVKLTSSTPFEKRTVLAKGDMSIDGKALTVGGIAFPLEGITSASVVSGRNLTFVCDKKDYTVRGGPRFDPVKYMFALNRLDSAMHKNKSDRYFDLEV